MRLVRPSLAFAALFLAACQGAEPAAPSAAPASGVDAPAASANATNGATAGPAFKDMDHEQRVDFMKRVVLPKMKAEFAAVEPDEFSDMKCATCHGDGARDKTFEMPNAKLPKLPAPTDRAGWDRLAAEEPEMLEFMKMSVVPQMAALLGEPPYDPATHAGFGCFNCHTAEE